MNFKKHASARRTQLIKNIKAHYKTEHGVIVLFANFEQESLPFTQEATFYYYTGSHEPASALLIDIQKNKSVLFIPNTQNKRAQWIKDAATISQEYVDLLGIDEIKTFGEPIGGYSLPPLHEKSAYTNLLQELKKYCDDQQTIFTCLPAYGVRYAQQAAHIHRLTNNWLPLLTKQIIDISPLVSAQRCIKDEFELKCMNQAIYLTCLVQATIATRIKDRAGEAEIQADIRGLIAAAEGTLAFEPIVASGPNACFVHYQQSNRVLQKNDLVIVDCGARVQNYCADITRTYAVNNKFNTRYHQLLYGFVVQAQELIASHAKPGMFLHNPEKPELSLNHIMKDFFAQHNLSHAVLHGIGHFLGLDVHDVGDLSQPLQAGMVITIEPGLYLPTENCGIRIEDDYLITDTGTECLSAELTKTI